MLKRLIFILVFLSLPTIVFSAEGTTSNVPAFKAPKHWCFGLPRLQQRVECRLGLTKAALEEELAKQYLPEECRVLRNKKQQTDCVARYKALQPCWIKPIGDERTACAREVLQIPDDLATAKKECLALAGKTRASRQQSVTCLRTLRQNIYHFVKFRFYDLNERVEDFMNTHDDGDPRPGTQFIVTSELNTQRFNRVFTKRERERIIRDERAAWKKFVDVAKPDDTRDFFDEALQELSSVE